jgi:hypothetical protein
VDCGAISCLNWRTFISLVAGPEQSARAFEVTMVVVASRILSLNDSSKTPIPIEIFAPTQHKDGSWSCLYEIGWPEGRRSFEGWGEDSAQALVMALEMVGAELYSSAYHKSGQLMWDKLGSGYGFPVLSTLRDSLVGDDAKYL